MSCAICHGMRCSRFLMIAGVCIFVNGLVFPSNPAYASRLTGADHGSTVPQNCDLCWSPSAGDSTKLPSTLQPYRPHHPRSSRPHRRPSGRYRIGPHSTIPAQLGRMPRMRPPFNQPIRVIDGDTFKMGPERIRLKGIDTPELSEYGGDTAKHRLEQLLHDGPIRIVPYGQDVYGRTIGDVFINGRNIADVLRSEGYAKPSS